MAGTLQPFVTTIGISFANATEQRHQHAFGIIYTCAGGSEWDICYVLSE